MAVSHLTERKLQALQTTRTQEDFWDDGLPGFGVRVTSGGRKTFVLMYRLHGVKHRLTLGTYPTLSLADARQHAKTLLGEVARGGNPAAQKQSDREALTFEQLAELYFERHARHHLRPSTMIGDQRKLRHDVFARWRGRPAKELRRRDVAELLDAIVERGAPYTAFNVRAAISKVFNWGIGRDLVEHNPCHALPRPAKLASRDRVLSEVEIRTLWGCQGAISPLMAASFKLRLITAQRGHEVQNLRWEQVDGPWWTIPAEYSKNHKPQRVYLAPPAQAILEQLRGPGEGSPWVLPSARSQSGRVEKLNLAAFRLREASGVVFRWHDLRRTAATMMTQMGIPRLVVSKVLNHTQADASVTAIYDRHSYDPEKREAWCRWADRLEEIVGGPLAAGMQEVEVGAPAGAIGSEDPPARELAGVVSVAGAGAALG